MFSLFRNNRRKHAVVTEGKAAGQLDPVEDFHETVTITSAAAGTAVPIIPAARVGAGRRVFLRGFIARVNGTTVWATTANVFIRDTAGTPVDFVTMAVAALTSQARVVPGTANVTLNDAYSLGTGGGVGEGLQLQGNANGTGSNLVVTVWGVIR